MALINIDLTVEQIADIITDLNEFEKRELKHILNLRFEGENENSKDEGKSDLLKILSKNKVFSLSSLF